MADKDAKGAPNPSGAPKSEPLKQKEASQGSDGRPQYVDRDVPAQCGCCAKLCTACGDEGDEPLGFIPDDKRKMTDLCCCVVFIIFWVGMVGVASTGFALGNPRRLFYGTDYEGNTCGVSDGYKGDYLITYPRMNEDYVYNVRLALQGDFDQMRFYGVCQEKCPSALDVVCNYDITAEEKPFADACVRGAIVSSSEQARRLIALGAEEDRVEAFEEEIFEEFDLPYGEHSQEHSSHARMLVEREHRSDREARGLQTEQQESICERASRNCWLQPTNSVPVLNRCVPDFNVTDNGRQACVLPPGITNYKDPRCVLMQDVIAADVFKPPQPSLVLDQLQSAKSTWSRYFGDLQRSAWVIFLCAVVFGCLFGFAFVKLTQMFVSIVVWTIVVLTVVVSVFFAIFCYARAGILNAQAVQSRAENLLDTDFSQYDGVSQSLDDPTRYRTAYKVAAYTMTAVSILLIGIIIAVRYQIKNAIAIIKLAAMSMFQMPLLIFLPFAGAALMLAFLAWWAYAAAALASAGSVTLEDVAGAVDRGYVQKYFPGTNATAILKDLSNNNGTIARYETVDTLKYLLLYHFFGLLWTNQFILCVGVMTIGGAVGAYYFSLDGRESSPVYGERLKRWKIRQSWRTTGAALETNPATEHEHEEHHKKGGGSKGGGVGGMLAFLGMHHAEHAKDKAAHDPTKALKDESTLGDVPRYIKSDGTVGSANDPDAEEIPDFTLYHKHGPWGNYEIAASLWRAVRYHLGTASFGSFLIAFVQMIRFVFQYMSTRLEQLERRNAAAHYIRCCIGFALWLLEQMVRFVSTNAMFFTAVKGQGYCRSARNAFLLLFRYTALLAIVNAVADVIMFLGKISVTLLCGYFAYLFLDNLAVFQPGGKQELTGTWVPVMVTMAFAYGVASAFFTVWEVAIDAAMVCFALDMDESLMYPRNKGKMGRYGIPLHYRSPDMRGGCPSCCYRSPPFSWCCFDLSSCCCGMFACCTGCCGPVRTAKRGSHDPDPLLQARTAAYVAPAVAAAASSGRTSGDADSDSDDSGDESSDRAKRAAAAAGFGAAGAAMPAAIPGASPSNPPARFGTSRMAGGIPGGQAVSKFDQQYVQQPSLDTLHRVARNARRHPGHFVHFKHALEELERREDMERSEEQALKQLLREIDSMKDSSRDFLVRHAKTPRTTKKPYLARLIMEETGVRMTERAVMNLRLDRQEEARWLLEVEQARMELQREANSQIFGGGGMMGGMMGGPSGMSTERMIQQSMLTAHRQVAYEVQAAMTMQTGAAGSGMAAGLIQKSMLAAQYQAAQQMQAEMQGAAASSGPTIGTQNPLGQGNGGVSVHVNMN